jgi:hypothetical protein
MPDLDKTPRQGNLFEWARRAAAAPAKPPAVQITLANVRHQLHVCMIMQMAPNYTEREHSLLANLERHLRCQIREMLGR